MVKYRTIYCDPPWMETGNFFAKESQKHVILDNKSLYKPSKM